MARAINKEQLDFYRGVTHYGNHDSYCGAYNSIGAAKSVAHDNYNRRKNENPASVQQLKAVLKFDETGQPYAELEWVTIATSDGVTWTPVN